MSVFSKEYGGLTQAVVTDCVIFPENQKNTSDAPKFFHTTKAMWDTGATNTIITPKIIKQLKLKPFAEGGVSGVGGDVEGGVYKINIGLPGGQVVYNITAYESDLEYDILIGMDIILLGDFCLTNKDGKSVFSFRIPSQEHIFLNDLRSK